MDNNVLDETLSTVEINVVAEEAKPETLLSDEELKSIAKTTERFGAIYDKYIEYSRFKVGDILIRFSHSQKEPDKYSNTAKTKRYKVVHTTPNGLIYTKAFNSSGDLSKVVVCICDIDRIAAYHYCQDPDVVDAMFVGDGEYSPAADLKATLAKIRKLRKINYPNRITCSSGYYGNQSPEWVTLMKKLKVGKTLFSIDDKFEEVTEWVVESKGQGLLTLKNTLGETKSFQPYHFNTYSNTYWFYNRPITRQDLDNGRA